MNKLSYSAICQQRIDNFFSFFDLSPENPFYFSYLNCRRNIARFLGIKEEQKCLAFFQKQQIYLHLSSEDQKQNREINFESFSIIDSLKEMGASPKIYCTYHMGAFRLIPFLLIEAGIDFTLVVDEMTYKNQSSDFELIYMRLNKCYKADFSILNAEDPSIGIKLIRQIRQGKSVLFYIDGNSGVGGMGRNDNKLTQVDFLNIRIWARKGIAFLGYATNTPIVPIISLRNEDYYPEFYLKNSISLNRHKTKDEEINHCTQELFSILEEYLLKSPEQWEGWQYIHLFEGSNYAAENPLDFSQLNLQENSVMQFNSFRFDFYRKDNKWHLFDLHTAYTWPISDGLYKALSILSIHKLHLKDILKFFPTTLFEELLSKQVLLSK